MRHWFVFLVVGGLSAGRTLHAQSFPQNLTPLACAGNAAQDSSADAAGAVGASDLVGDPLNPAVFVQNDGSFLFVRLRLDDDPRQGPNLAPLAFGFLLDTNDPSDFELLVHVNGLVVPNVVTLQSNTTQQTPNDPQDTTEAIVQTYPATHFQVIPAGSSLGGTPDFFLDIAVPVDDLSALGATGATIVSLGAGSSEAAQALNRDFACQNGAASPTLTAVLSDPFLLDPEGDEDADGLSNEEERQLGTDPDDDDTDDDNLSDGEEASLGTNLLIPDGDLDGILDGDEVDLGTDPTSSDSDNDGLSDGIEVNGANPTNPLDDDSDNDGLLDGDEDLNRNGLVEPGESDPNSADTDGDLLSDLIEIGLGSDPSKTDSDDDGLPDQVEVNGQNPTDPTSTDTDNDGIEDGDEDADLDGALDNGETNPNSDDTDNDGISDAQEIALNIDPTDEDNDDDGLLDGEELALGTNLLVDDTDGDDILDGVEVNGQNPTNPSDGDTDDDGLSDGEEDANNNGTLNNGETNPNNADTDNDGLSDGVEVNGANPTNPLDSDSDNDGLSDGDEDALGIDPTEADTDADGISDSEELALGLDPDNDDTDGDGLSDGEEDGEGTDPQVADTDADGIVDGVEVNGENPTNPLDSDSDNDSLLDGEEDKNANGEVDEGESDPNLIDTDGDTIDDEDEIDGQTDPSEPDTDGDGVNDNVELDNDTNPRNPDTDNDGLNDGDEETAGTDPLDPDTDNGGLNDGEEISLEANPLDPSDDASARFAVRGAGGCAVDGDGDGSVWLLALLLAALYMTRSRRALSVAAAMSVAISASAQQGEDLDAAIFKPTAGESFFGVRTAKILPKLQFDAGVWLSFADNPVVIVAKGSDSLLSTLVSTQTTMDIAAAVGIAAFAEIGVALPIAVLLQGDDAAGLRGGAISGGAVGDIRLSGKIRLLAPDKGADGVSISFTPELTLPSGNGDKLFGAASPSILLAFAADWRTSKTTLGAFVGPRLEEASQLANLNAGSQLSFGVGASQKVSQLLTALAEIDGRVGLTEDGQSPIEGRLGLKIRPTEQIAIPIAFGAGMTSGFGSPDYRILIGATYDRAPAVDYDGDGIIKGDKCPKDTEDKDNFEDTDGCPEADNDNDSVKDDADQCPINAGPGSTQGCPDQDNDAIADRDDACPTQAGLQSFKGCPDQDNDQVSDLDDKCADKAEDKDGFEDTDGCPDEDNDNDGILDAADRCPNEAEDKDNFEEEDGCPELDNDFDGYNDASDKCPNEAEDRDNYQDEDGCIDLDNDGDKIQDKEDLCPDQPEDGKGPNTRDGCPDGTKAVISGSKIVIIGAIFFDTNKASIQKKSLTLLDAVAKLLIDNPGIRIRIEGNTDDVGDDAKNQTLSEQRAQSVLQYLVKKGIDATRLESTGYGETKPVVRVDVLDPKKQKKEIKAARELNRRVEFVITSVN